MTHTANRETLKSLWLQRRDEAIEEKTILIKSGGTYRQYKNI